jgi:beta-carotene ketolase (CrtW type)
MKVFQFNDNLKGLTMAGVIIGAWLISLIFLLTVEINEIPVPVILLGIIWQTFLYTGLFITAHDAMHGTVFPKNRKANDLIGSLAVKLFALFSYQRMLKKHWEHHRHPASSKDPDFHDGIHPGFIRWYSHFMMSYVTWWQILGMAITFNLFIYLCKIETINLVIFWIIPPLLSTFQLFYFGTYLPHREPGEPFRDDHRARSNDYRVLWSFLSCYHFGYHWEHHEYPHIAWWRLPKIRKLTLKKSG